MADFIFGRTVAGSVLDVNCGSGFFCLEALARGARRAVGWDIDPERIERARSVAQTLGSTAEFEARDVTAVAPDEAFDVILCLDLLHRVRNPLSLLEALARLAGERLIVEVVSLEGEGARRLDLARRRRVLARAPVIVVGRGGTSPPFDREAKFSFTPSALENLLRFQHQRFARMRTVATPTPGRFLVIAERRRIEHLVVLSGPMSSGKSQLIREIRADHHSQIGDALGISDLGTWPFIGARHLTNLTEPRMKGLILHYDFLRPFRRGTGTFEEDEALQLLEGAEAVSFVTLWTPPARLERQHLDGKIYRPEQMDPKEPVPSLPSAHGPRGVRAWLGRLPLVGRVLRRREGPAPRHLDVLSLYHHPAQVIGCYRRWFDYCDGHGLKTRTHLIVESGDRLRTYTRGEWEDEVRTYGSDLQAGAGRSGSREC
jgi:SAM-dependent methyltransferase